MIIAWLVGWESDSRENQEREESKRFKKGDRVRIDDLEEDVDDYLQEDNRVGTVVDVDSHECYWLHMDKPVIREQDEGDLGAERPSVIPDGYAFYAADELELMKPTDVQKPFDINQWRKNLKRWDKVKVVRNPERPEDFPLFVEEMNTRKGRVVTLAKECDKQGWWKIEGDSYNWASRWFEPVDRPVNKSELSKPRKAKELKEQPPDPRLKTIVQTALELIQDIEKTFKDSEKYPIFGMNLKSQKPVTRTQKSNLGESLLSLGVVLYHLFTGQSEHNNHSYLLDGYPKPEDMPEEFWQVVNKLLKSEYKSLDELKKDLKNFKDGGQK